MTPAPRTILTNSELKPAARLLLWLMSLLACTLYLLRIALLKQYSLDEFQYSHAAWLVSIGQVPYRDFFEFHFPLAYQVLAIPYLFSEANPEHIRLLRLAMIPVVGLALWSMSRLNRQEARWVAWAAPVFALSAPAFILTSTEVRPDPFAFSLFLVSIAMLVPGRDGVVRPFTSGVMFGLAVWGSQKAAVYGIVYILAFLLDASVNRRRSRKILGSPLRWTAGLVLVATVVSVYLVLTGSVGAWFQQTVIWAHYHEAHYPGFPWTRFFVPAVKLHSVLFVLAALGLLRSLHRWCQSPCRLASSEILVIGALGSTLFSFLFARAPFPYALLPFFGLLCVFAARGLAWVTELVSRRERSLWQRKRLRIGFTGVILGIGPLHGFWLVESDVDRSNSYQHAVLADLHRLTLASDPVFDNSGGYSTRPHVGFQFYNSALDRTRDAAELAERIPQGIREAECTVFMHDARFPFLPEPTRQFIRSHFQCYNADLWLWGQHFTGQNKWNDFEAVRTGSYFVQPASVLEEGTLLIDGEPVDEALLQLQRGRHSVEYRGPKRDFYLLWLPRNGERYRPKPGLDPKFSSLF